MLWVITPDGSSERRSLARTRSPAGGRGRVARGTGVSLVGARRWQFVIILSRMDSLWDIQQPCSVACAPDAAYGRSAGSRVGDGP
jgi:hypothetical protein